nr:uncharacterized protein LOC129419238 isoform X2 [Misgurnus anguillicaudatus]
MRCCCKNKGNHLGGRFAVIKWATTSCDAHRPSVPSTSCSGRHPTPKHSHDSWTQAAPSSLRATRMQQDWRRRRNCVIISWRRCRLNTLTSRPRTRPLLPQLTDVTSFVAVYSTSNSYSSQSWYSYPAYPVSAGFWNNFGQSQLCNSPVQYPVWSHEQTAFRQQDEVSAGDLVKVVTDRSSERILMPPLAVLLTSGRKRRREETLNKCLRETADEEKMKTIRGMQSFFRTHTVWRKKCSLNASLQQKTLIL